MQWRELSWDKMKGNIRQIDEIPMIINVAKVNEQLNTVSYPKQEKIHTDINGQCTTYWTLSDIDLFENVV